MFTFFITEVMASNYEVDIAEFLEKQLRISYFKLELSAELEDLTATISVCLYFF